MLTSGSYAADLPIDQMVNATWTAQQGAPQNIRFLAEAQDGTLLIGAPAGLFTFDGLSFAEYRVSPAERPLPAHEVRSLLVARDGAAWVSYIGEVVRIQSGHVDRWDTVDGIPMGAVGSLQEAADGTMWAISMSRSLIRLSSDGTWKKQNVSAVAAGAILRRIVIDSRGSMWLAAGGRLYLQRPTDSELIRTNVETDVLFGAAENADGSLWLTDVIGDSGVNRLQHVDREGKLLGRIDDPNVTTSILRAPDGALWLGTQDHGIFRYPADAFDGGATQREPQSFKVANGLASDDVLTLLVDVDGDVWVGGKRGLNRFRRPILKRFFPNGDDPGLTSVCADQQGVIWIFSTRLGLRRVSNDTSKSYDDGRLNAYAMSCGPRGPFLMTISGAYRIEEGGLEQLPAIPGALPYSTFAIYELPDQTLVAADFHGFWALAAGEWHPAKAASPVDRPMDRLFVDSAGRQWRFYLGPTVGIVEAGRETLLPPGAAGVGRVYAFAQGTLGILVTGADGVALWNGVGFDPLNFADRGATRGVIDLVEAANGDLFLNAAGGIIRIPRDELDLWKRNHSHAMPTQTIVEGDFVGPAPIGKRAEPGAGREANGRLWFAMSSGVVQLDPEELQQGKRRPTLVSRAALVDGRAMPANGQVPPKPQVISLQYLGVNLARPEAVIYRRKLEGLDVDWQDVGHRTEAIYSRLPPGAYTLRVMASNGDGKWTEPLAAAAFTIEPSYYQTGWFVALCVLGGLAIVWMAVSLRVRLITAAVKGRADERIRIARELHDTLLQGVQGLQLMIHAAGQRASRDGELLVILNQALAKADALIIEGRDRVLGLRFDYLGHGSFIEALENLGRDLNRSGSVMFQVRSEGSPRLLQLSVLDELFNIAREVITNAFRHAASSHIEVSVIYGDRQLRLTCTDDGKGFDAAELPAGAKGHWGLKGVAERAKEMGALFTITSSDGNGTRVQIEIPARVAYQRRGNSFSSSTG